MTRFDRLRFSPFSCIPLQSSAIPKNTAKASAIFAIFMSPICKSCAKAKLPKIVSDVTIHDYFRERLATQEHVAVTAASAVPEGCPAFARNQKSRSAEAHQRRHGKRQVEEQISFFEPHFSVRHDDGSAVSLFLCRCAGEDDSRTSCSSRQYVL
jgi:hypothetical protein